MLVISLLSWWYTDGWKTFTQEVVHGLRNTADFFSIASLLKTFFAPFRQISAHEKFLDRLISRIVGSVVRFLLILFGTIVIILGGAVGAVMMILWFLLPLLPIACVVLFMMGVVFYV